MYPASSTQKSQDLPLNIVGSNKFGQYPKISDEETINMIISDEWLVPFAGFKNRAQVSTAYKGRAIYSSERWGRVMVVIGPNVYGYTRPAINSTKIEPFFIGSLETSSGDVFIAENMVGQIAIVDGRQIYIYNWQNPTTPALVTATLPVDLRNGEEIIPGYITYLNSQFVVTNEATGSWFLSGFNDGLDWNPFNGGPWFTYIQTKPTNIIAAVRWPGRGNLLAIIGRTVTEMWTFTGGALFPYQKNQSVNIDYGCINAATIAANENYIMWLGVNEQSGPVIMISAGSDAKPLSTDGIDFKLAKLKNPAKSNAFFVKQNGHLFYQITFSDPRDNVTYIYDFTTNKFFSLADQNMNYHPADSVAYYNDTWYFVSLNDGSIYETSTDLTQYDYTAPDSSEIKLYEIPRVRITPTFRLPDNSRFRINGLSVLMEQGNDPYYQGSVISYLVTQGGESITQEDEQDIFTESVVEPYQPTMELQLSKDGGTVFGNSLRKDLNAQGDRKNRVTFWQLGSANEVTCKFNFWGKSRFLVGGGLITVTR